MAARGAEGDDTDEEWLIDERNRAAIRSRRGQVTAAPGRVLRAEEAHFKIHDLLLLVRSKAVALRMTIGCVQPPDEPGFEK